MSATDEHAQSERAKSVFEGTDPKLADDSNAEEELDPRASTITREAIYTDLPDKDLQKIMDIALRSYNRHVLLPTKSTWRKEEGSIKELQLDVERTKLQEIAADVKKRIDSHLGGCWHVVYGRDFATYVTHQRLSFCHFKMEGADIVVWRHAG